MWGLSNNQGIGGFSRVHIVLPSYRRYRPQNWRRWRVLSCRAVASPGLGRLEPGPSLGCRSSELGTVNCGVRIVSLGSVAPPKSVNQILRFSFIRTEYQLLRSAQEKRIDEVWFDYVISQRKKGPEGRKKFVAQARGIVFKVKGGDKKKNSNMHWCLLNVPPSSVDFLLRVKMLLSLRSV